MLRIAARLALIVLLFCAGCGGGGSESNAEHAGVDAFPDILEIARAELGDDAVLHEVAVSEKEISFVHAQFGRNVRVKYNTNVVFTGNERVSKKLNPAATFGISEVSAEAPAKLLAAVQEREEGEVTDFTATFARARQGALAWHAKATVNGAVKQYDADANGTMRG